MRFKVFFLLLFLMIFGTTVSAAEDRYIIKLNSSVQLFSVDEAKSNKDYISVSADELQDYIDAGVVEYYGPDYEIELFSTPMWNLDYIKTNFPQRIGCSGTNVKIGVIDSGIVDGVFPNVIRGYNYIDKNTDTSDKTLHGTCVSAIAATSPFGVAINAQFVPLKCFNDKTTNLSYILDALVDAVDVYDCDVINMSIGIAEEKITENGNEILNLFREKIDYAASKGAILVAAAGNDKDATINYPAAFDNVIGVGSVNDKGVRSEFSNYNYSVHVVAPGEEVWAPYIDEGEISGNQALVINGTSFAAPHVSGLAAIARCIDTDITQAGFAQLLADTAVDTEADTIEGWDEYYGYGLIDCEAAVKKLIEGQFMHISPIRQVNDYVNAVIYNNTAESKDALCICVYYDENGRMIDCIQSKAEIGAYRIYNFSNPYKGNVVKYITLSNDGELMPLGLSKEK